MKKYVCRECGYTFSLENPEPDYDKLVETDEPMDETPNCPKCGGACKLEEEK